MSMIESECGEILDNNDSVEHSDVESKKNFLIVDHIELEFIPKNLELCETLENKFYTELILLSDSC